MPRCGSPVHRRTDFAWNSPTDRGCPPAVEPIPHIRWPAHLELEEPGVGLGFVVPRRRGAGSLVSILDRRLRRRLRHDLGLVYDVVADYEPLDAHVAAGLVGADCTAGDAPKVFEVVLAALDALARGDATPEELAESVADMEEGMSDPTAVSGLLDVLVRDRLLGMRGRSAAELYEEQHATTAGDVAAAAEAARSSALLMADIEHHPPDFAPYPFASEAIRGREVKPFLSVLGIGPKQRLIIGPDGVSLRLSDGHVTVRYDECVILERPVEDELVMWGRDGTRLYVPAAFWRGGEQVIAEIARSVPTDIVVREKFSADYFD